MLRIPGVTNSDNLRQGEYALLRIFEDTLVLNYTEPTRPARIFCIRFSQILQDGQSISDLLDASNLKVHLLEEINFASPGDEFGQFYNEQV